MERKLSSEEFEALTKDMNEVLEKHGANMSVRAVIELFKEEPNGTEETPKID